MTKTENSIYIVDPKIAYKTFKKIHDRLVKDPGPVPKEGLRILWEMNRDRKLFLWFSADMPNDMGVGLRIPKRYANHKIFYLKGVK